MNWLNWLCTCFVIEWLCVQTLLRVKQAFFFVKIYFGVNVNGQKNPSCKNGKQRVNLVLHSR